jgi:hypothetical protein
MEPLPWLNEDVIRRYVGDTIFSRGLDYYEGGAVDTVFRRGTLLQAEVQGSSYPYYRVQIVLGEQRLLSRSGCSPTPSSRDAPRSRSRRRPRPFGLIRASGASGAYACSRARPGPSCVGDC